MAQTQICRGAATNVVVDGDQGMVQYHRTIVVKWDKETIELNSGGRETATTKLRMNQASNEFCLGYRVYQKDFEWYVDYKGETVEFFDGIELKRG